MSLSKKARRGISAFNRIQLSDKRFKYVLPQLDAHEKALREDKRWTIANRRKK